MILNKSESTAQYSAGIQTHQTSIDPRNINHILTILSSNLYSNPEDSFIRETISNAWDSHVEAGNTATPVIVVLDKGKVSIRDFGTGLSPERFRKVYCCIGSSTKRDSNDYIGAFGIGRFSALACSDSVHITSYYNGTAYYYLMVKSNNSIELSLLKNEETKEANGVEVSIYTENVFWYREACYNSSFFPNVSVVDKLNLYVNPKCRDYGDYFACNRTLQNNILLGYVLYPYTGNNSNLRSVLKKLAQAGVAVHFDINEMQVTPNRENIIYNTQIEKLIEEKSNKVLNTIKTKVSALLKQNFTNIVDLLSYYDTFSHKIIYKPLYDKIITEKSSYGFPWYSSDILKNCITYNGSGITFSDICNTKKYIINTLKCNSKVAYPTPKSCNYLQALYNKEIYVLNKTRIPAYIRNYLKDRFTKDSIILSDRAISFLNSDILGGSRSMTDIKNDLLTFLKNNITEINCNLEEVLQYKKQKSKNHSGIRVVPYNRSPVTYSNIEGFINYLKSTHRSAYISTQGMLPLYEDIIYRYSFLNVLIVNKQLYKELIALATPIIRPIDSIVKDRKLIMYNSIAKICENNTFCYKDLRSLREVCSPQLYNIIDKICAYHSTFSAPPYDDIIPTDIYWENATKHILQMTNSLCSKMKRYEEYINYNTSTFIKVAIVLKYKLFKPSYTKYLRYKNSPLKSLLCRK